MSALRATFTIATIRPGAGGKARDGVRRAVGHTSGWSIAVIARDDEAGPASGAGGHIPVLIDEVVEWLAPRAGGRYVDATFGAGGYTRAILKMAGAHVVGLDRDQSAIARGADLVQEAGGRLELVEERFGDLQTIVADASVDGVVFDLGVSSMQLDEAERGFSFRRDGRLDMRMGRDGPSAADIVARASERDLAAIIGILGEERHARAVARALVKARGEHAIVTTRALADIVARVVHARDTAIHPATRTFQALRIFVNEELSELARGLAAAEHVLKPAGRLVVVSFHSLEDRIVKNFLNERSRAPAFSRHQPEMTAPPPSFRLLTRKPETPGETEIAANPRARSAKLRAAERTDAPARATAVEELLPRLPSLADVMRGRP
jgi:16S rRNA (cytosine1402-N4)-methyltransferase